MKLIENHTHVLSIATLRVQSSQKFHFAKFGKCTPLENNPLYSIIHKCVQKYLKSLIIKCILNIFTKSHTKLYNIIHCNSTSSTLRYSTDWSDARYKVRVNYTHLHGVGKCTCTLRQIHVYTWSWRLNGFIQGDKRVYMSRQPYTLHLICTVHVRIYYNINILTAISIPDPESTTHIVHVHVHVG